MEFVIRCAEKMDIYSIIEMCLELTVAVEKMGIEYVINDSPDSKAQKEKHYKSAIDSEIHKIVVVEHDKELVGFVEACINEKDFNFCIDKYVYIAYYYIKPGYRDIQMMIRLYNVIQDWARDIGINYICSDVDGVNETSYKLQRKFFGMKSFKIRMFKSIAEGKK